MNSTKADEVLTTELCRYKHIIKHGGNAFTHQSEACSDAKLGSPDAGTGCSGLLHRTSIQLCGTGSEATHQVKVAERNKVWWMPDAPDRSYSVFKK